ncbi:E1-E2 ATPase-domain-containing protein [Penicillium sp. IBT 16267x]|nr:E1-E2 ATPase-domain-containing protein [Penicillium sp. IBT 16267x]
MSSSPDTTDLAPTLQGNAEVTETSMLLNDNSGLSPMDMRLPASIRSSAPSEGWDRQSRMTSPHTLFSPKTDVTSPRPHLLSVPFARPRGKSVESESSIRTLSNYGRDTYVPSSHRSLGRDNAGDDEGTLNPEPGRESDFEVENNKFAFSPGQLNKLLNLKNFRAFRALGGLRRLEKGLRTNARSGLSMDETALDGTVSFDEVVSRTFMSLTKAASSSAPPPATTTGGSSIKQPQDRFSDRRRVFGFNKLPERKLKSIWELVWIAYDDKVLILLSIAAAVALAVGIPQSMRGTGVEWVEGAAIIVAIIVVVTVGAANDWQKERQFAKLNKKKEDRYVKVIRSGKMAEVSIYDIIVGEVVYLEPGDMIPADGVLIYGHGVKCDESSVTGESDLLRKTGGDEAYQAVEQNKDLKMDPSIMSGAKLKRAWGLSWSLLPDDGETTPLQTKLNALADYIAKVGLASGLLLFVALFIKFLVRLKGIQGGADAKGQAFLWIFIVAVTIVVVAVPEGLPLAVTVALAFATTRMIQDNNLVRLLRACETMGNATTICSDKTGTLTENKMSVVAATVGTTARFGDQLSSNHEASKSGPGILPVSEFTFTLSPSIKNHLLQSIALNSTVFEGDHDGVMTFIGSKTETAFLSFAREQLGLGPVGEERANAKLMQMFPFDSNRQCMAVVIRMDNGKYRILVKGAAEILVRQSTQIVQDPTNDLAEVPLSDEKRNALETIITNYASRSLKCIALVSRDFEQ